MHAVAGDTGQRLTIAGVFCILTKRMGNFMLPLVTAGAGLDLVFLQIQGPFRMRRHMTFKAFSVFHRNAFDRLQGLFHKHCLFLRFFMARSACIRFTYSQILLFRRMLLVTHDTAAFFICQMDIVVFYFQCVLFMAA